jgi:hypothetical protein
MNEAIDQVVFLNTQHCVQSSNASSLGNFMLSEASVAQMSVEPGRKIEDPDSVSASQLSDSSASLTETPERLISKVKARKLIDWRLPNLFPYKLLQ